MNDGASGKASVAARIVEVSEPTMNLRSVRSSREASGAREYEEDQYRRRYQRCLVRRESVRSASKPSPTDPEIFVRPILYL